MTTRSRVLTGPELPYRLADLSDPPRELYVRGELPRGPAVAVVGTRLPTLSGLRFAEQLSQELAHAGVAVLSGGAQGIDTACHEGALRAGGVTVVVAPSGFERPFPSGNRSLFERVLEQGGAYASLVADDAAAAAHGFFARNACLVALAHVVVVVEAPFRSGARNAARWARVLGRPLLVVPHAPWNETGSGCLLELRAGAGFCESSRDVFRELDRLSLKPLPLRPRTLSESQGLLPFEPGRSPPVTPRAPASAVSAAIAAGAAYLDQICDVTGLSAALVQRELLELTLAGVVLADPSGRLSLAFPASLAVHLRS